MKFLTLLLTLGLFSHSAMAKEISCGVYVDLQFDKYLPQLIQRLTDQGFKVVNKSSARFLASNYQSAENESAVTWATLGKNAEGKPLVLEVRGYDYLRALGTRRRLANRLTLKLIDVLPTCEEAKVMLPLEVDLNQ